MSFLVWECISPTECRCTPHPSSPFRFDPPTPNSGISIAPAFSQEAVKAPPGRPLSPGNRDRMQLTGTLSRPEPSLHPFCSPRLRLLFGVSKNQRKELLQASAGHSHIHIFIPSFIRRARSPPDQALDIEMREHSVPMGNWVSHTSSICISPTTPISLGMIICPPAPLGAGWG